MNVKYIYIYIYSVDLLLISNCSVISSKKKKIETKELIPKEYKLF